MPLLLPQQDCVCVDVFKSLSNESMYWSNAAGRGNPIRNYPQSREGKGQIAILLVAERGSKGHFSYRGKIEDVGSEGEGREGGRQAHSDMKTDRKERYEQLDDKNARKDKQHHSPFLNRVHTPYVPSRTTSIKIIYLPLSCR